MIPYGKQSINQSDIDSVVEVLQSDFLTQGPKVPEFESCVARYCGSEFGIAVNSATSALHLSCLALGVGEGDLVWTSATSFVASANCARYCGAKVDFLDIDLETLNIDIPLFREKLLVSKNNNSIPKVVIVVHMAGQPCDMKSIFDLSKEFGFKIIEDASHAIGSAYNGKKTGSCCYSDITVFSFHPVKVITTAEGGLALTNDESIAKKIQLLRSHGVTRDESLFEYENRGSWYYEQIELGFNYRMTDIQAALGVEQMNRLDHFVQIRNSIAGEYNNRLAELPLILPQVSVECFSSFHLYIIQLRNQSEHGKIFESLREHGVGVNLHYTPIYLQPYYQNFGFRSGYCPNSETYASRAISLPMHPGLTEEDISLVVNTIEKVIQS